MTFTATDGCGNESTKIGRFTLKDVHPPQFVGSPELLEVICGDIENFPAPDYTNGCEEASLIFIDDLDPSDCEEGQLINRTWIVSNGSGGDTVYQVIQILPVSSILPVELIDFDGEKVKSGVQLTWATSSELNNDFFTLERSLDGQNFEAIAEVGGMGTSNEKQT